ncbi:MAG: site-specific integrase [Archangium sp.]|nr:site-specific integrase [Archangium sp.]MDP3576303.1 site-specific integrase [Archangium sp.]
MEAVTTAPTGIASLAKPRGSRIKTKTELAKVAMAFATAAKAENTRKAYRTDWRTFVAWCEQHDVSALPADPEHVALYLADRASDAKVSTISRALVAISQAHVLANLPSPRSAGVVRQVLQGIRRKLGTAKRQARPLLPRDLRELLAVLPSSLIGARDRSLLTLGFSGAFRRSELIGLNVDDLAFEPDGLKVVLRRSKTDQEGKGRVVGIPYGAHPETCPVRLAQKWLETSALAEGPLYRQVSKLGRLGAKRLNGRSISKLIKRRAHEAGLDPELLSGHSLRSGLVTAAAKAGKSISSIKRQTGHRSIAMVEEYIRNAHVFEDNAFSGLDL